MMDHIDRMHLPEKELYQQLFQNVLPILKDYVSKHDDPNTPVIKYKTADEIKEVVQTKLNERSILDCNSEEEGSENDQGNYSALMKQVQAVLDNSVRASKPFYMDKLCTGTDAVGVLAESIKGLLNTNMYIYAVSPVFSVLEHEIIKQLCCDFVGFPEDQYDGIMCPGGSYSNLLSMIVARNSMYPETKTKGYAGLKGKKLVIFTSLGCHYSIVKNASVLGLGIDGVVKIETDSNGRMKPSALEKAIQKTIQQGDIPFYINSTAGTTVLGAFDPIEEIVKIGHKYHCWVHVDGSWGGSVIVSEKYRHNLKGLENADSFTWNPHKAMRVPIQCSFSLYRHHDILRQTNDLAAEYLFKDDHASMEDNEEADDSEAAFNESEYDLGKKTVMCGRSTDVLKFWLSWLYHGRQGFEHRLNTGVENTKRMVQLLKQRKEKFMIVNENPQFLNVGFWYLTPRIRKMKKGSQEWNDALNDLSITMYREIRKRGNIMVSTAPLPTGSPFFWRLVLINEKLSEKDLNFILDEFEAIGEQM